MKLSITVNKISYTTVHAVYYMNDMLMVSECINTQYTIHGKILMLVGYRCTYQNSCEIYPALQIAITSKIFFTKCTITYGKVKFI